MKEIEWFSPWGNHVTRAEVYHYGVGSTDPDEALAIADFVDREARK